MLSKAKHLSIESSIICHFERQRKIYIIYIKFYFVKSKNLANCHFERSEKSNIKLRSCYIETKSKYLFSTQHDKIPETTQRNLSN
ncbi:MAG: hypothetical protein SPJ16_04795, partial [Helicobacter sp.]|uniref:hypothetical protein n=1 Tax=Helicobacter sp. TaxID=218 RepID=UPI002A917A27